MATTNTVFLPAGHSLTITADAVTSGHAARIINGSPTTFTTIAVSTTTVIGPFSDPYYYRLVEDKGTFSTVIAASLDAGVLITAVDSDNLVITDGVLDIKSTTSVNIPVLVDNGPTTSMVVSGNGIMNQAVITLNNTPVDIAAASTNNGIGGVELIVFPAQYISVLGGYAYLSMSIDSEEQENFTDGAAEGTIGIGTTLVDDDTADIGTGAASDANITGSAEYVMESYAVSDVEIPNSTPITISNQDGMSDVSAILNISVDAADIDNSISTQILVSGVVTITYMNLGEIPA